MCVCAVVSCDPQATKGGADMFSAEGRNNYNTFCENSCNETTLLKLSSSQSDLIEDDRNVYQKYRMQCVAVFSVTLLIFSQGAHYGWFGPTYNTLSQPGSSLPITSDQGSWLASLLDAGSILGCIIGAISIDMLGRKPTILLASVPLIIGPIFYILATSVNALFIGRFISGISVGLSRIVGPIYIGEIVSPKIRGTLLAIGSAQFYLGLLCAFSVGPYVDSTTNSLILMIAPILCLLTFVWMPESPYFLIIKGDLGAARYSLTKFRGKEDVNEELFTLRNAVVKEQEEKGGIKELVTKHSNRQAFRAALVVTSSFKFAGVSLIISYMQPLLAQIGTIDPNLNGIAIVALQFITSGVSGVLMDRWGRKPLHVFSCFVTSIPLALLGGYFYFHSIGIFTSSYWAILPLLSMYLYQLTVSVGILPLVVVYTAEIFPTNVKGTAAGFFNIYLAILGILTIKLYQIVMDALGTYVSFWILSISIFVFGILSTIFMKETKQLSLIEVQADLKDKQLTVSQDYTSVY